MGPVNWIGVALAWLVAAALGVAFYGKRAMPKPPYWLHGLAALLLVVSTVMVGHMLARVGAETLEAKPWLYFMMTGGLALTFIGPALVIGAIRHGRPVSAAFYDWAYWLCAYLAMGLAFWITG
ncbi:DUF1761 domain-containing protein [Qipengyuania oceanensis]|uniref:DUF1761 domain-containing protein n=1 Tax=Qipengyuania oceanensis TaxID=1463597 RepID=A0A844YGZ1_9SPHN|nr:DUF1761 domain-containing protein [Qipengyuania oceanensis]MXO62284.1 DUF1761 domain-containing protein [Qipengyuania oceanensis]